MHISVERAHERGRTRLSWLDSKHSFSFGGYHNAHRMRFGALRVLNDDLVAAGNGFSPHEHSNMEIVTIIVSGTLEHKDSTGGGGRLRRGDVQAMTAGTGVTHSEMNPSIRTACHFLQVWIQTRKLGAKPEYDTRKFTLKRNQLATLAGPGGLGINANARILRAKTDRGRTITHLTTLGRGTFVFLIAGMVELDNEILHAGDSASITDAKEVIISAKSQSDVLVIDVPMAGKT
ncbi:MAG: pirin family protein [Nanoarchaeota archaeon]